MVETLRYRVVDVCQNHKASRGAQYMAPRDVDVKQELVAIKEASKRVCADKRTALAFLVKHGFLTSKGKLAGRYR